MLFWQLAVLERGLDKFVQIFAVNFFDFMFRGYAEVFFGDVEMSKEGVLWDALDACEHGA